MLELDDEGKVIKKLLVIKEICSWLPPGLDGRKVSQNLKRSHDSEHIPFGSNVSCMHSYSSVSISTRNLKCPASPISKIWLGKIWKNRSRDSDHTPFMGGLRARIW